MATSQQAMTTSASQQPVKGILKNKSSLACSLGTTARKSTDVLSKKSQRWDEMNILATYYIENEDIIKVDGPSTPDNSIDSDDEDVFASENFEALDPDTLARKLAAAKGTKPKYLIHDEQESSGNEDSDFSPEGKRSLLTTCCLFFFRCSIPNEEEKLQKSARAANEKQLEFEIKRKLHDNEGLSLKLARQLVSKELREVDEMSTPTTVENVNSEQTN